MGREPSSRPPCGPFAGSLRAAWRGGLLLAVAFYLAACSPRAHVPSAVPATDALQALFSLVNEVRSQGYDCGPAGSFGPAPALRYEARLARAARRHSAYMASRGVISHIGEGGSSVAERVTQEGYAWSWVGENLAYSSGFDMTPEQVLRGWLDSPGHCRNLLYPEFTEVGLGKVETYWTLVLATPSEP